MKQRAELFSYVDLAVTTDSLVATYDLDGRVFREVVTFEGVGSLNEPAVVALAQLWFLLAGLSYYKAGAAKRIDVGALPLGVEGRRLLEAALHDGLGEFSFRNDLPLGDVVIEGGTPVAEYEPFVDPNRILTPFGGGIDSVVTVTQLNPQLDQALFVVSPSSGRFQPLEQTAAVTGHEIVRATRTLDPALLRGDESFYNGHVPVTAMVTLLAAVAAVASGRGGVALSNEHSSSVANLRWDDREINHQWSKSLNAERRIADAIAERVGETLVVASFLRDRSELWVAKVFSEQTQFHQVFRSCNRAFSQVAERRANTWCGECDKCLFVNLVLAPFLSRTALRAIFSSEPLSDPQREAQLRTLVGIGLDHKPFECVGDPDESAVALRDVAANDEWNDVALLRDLASQVATERDLSSLLLTEGLSRVPAHWLR
jgi:UDP-N-acetyl-alpha-D-muramoyl-L-alanyl-L-glutamate epimerase